MSRRPAILAARLLRYALALTLFFGVAQLLGWRAHTAVLAGVAASGFFERVAGVMYLLFYTLFVLLVPILMLAAGMAWVANRVTQGIAEEPE